MCTTLHTKIGWGYIQRNSNPPNQARYCGFRFRLSGDEKSTAAVAMLSDVAPSDIISNLFLEDLERIWELKKWIPDPCNPHLHYLKPELEDE